MERLQRAIALTILVSEASHVFCCVLPTVVSVFSLLAGLGLISMLPAGLMEFHDLIHAYEMPLIMFSGVVLLLGWGLHALSLQIDCHNTGCAHEPCKPKKCKASKVLKIATILFLTNIVIYAAVHIPMENSKDFATTSTLGRDVHDAH